LTVDPASVSSEELEAVVAANPNINGMRMALADRYFAAEDYGSALDHYLYIAENNPTADEESKVLARIGWMAYITDQPEAAEDYVLASLRIDPTNAEATLYLGFITLYGLGDAEGAIPQLEAALELPNLSPSVVSQVEAALEEARQGGTP
jgi:tetratricopeptide (TPR) repeat protein